MTDRLFEVATDPHVKAAWANKDGTPSIYVGSEPALNQITLTLTNKLGQPRPLPAGEAKEYGKLGAGESAVYLFFDSVIPAAAVAAAKVGAAGWGAAKCFTDKKGDGYLAFAPTAPLRWDDGDSIKFEIEGLAPGQGSAGLLAVVVEAPGLEPEQGTAEIQVTVGPAPAAGNKALDLLVGFADGPEVYTGADQLAENDLYLYLTNPGTSPLVPDGKSAWEAGRPPTFKLNFVYGDRQGALTDVKNAAKIEVSLHDDYGNGWEAVEKHDQAASPYWTVQSNENKPASPGVPGGVLGTGSGGTVVLRISKILTELVQGLTYAYLSYCDIPGYDNGFFALEILKIDPVRVTKLTPSPAKVVSQGPTQVELAFEVENASYVSIPAAGYGKRVEGTLLSDTAEVTLEATTELTLIAADYATGQLVTESKRFEVEPLPLAIESFTATGPEVTQGPAGPVVPARCHTGVELAFSVSGAGFVTITNTPYAKATNTTGRFTDSITLQHPGPSIDTSTSFHLLAFNAASGQMEAKTLYVEVSPDPIRTVIVTGMVFDGDGQSGSMETSPNAKGSSYYMRDEDYVLNFPPGTFVKPGSSQGRGSMWVHCRADKDLPALAWPEQWLFFGDGSLEVLVSVFDRVTQKQIRNPFYFQIVQVAPAPSG